MIENSDAVHIYVRSHDSWGFNSARGGYDNLSEFGKS